MTPSTIIFAMVILSATNLREVQPMQATYDLAHVSNIFRFEVAAPLSRMAPLFGPEAERNWAGKHWNPVFLYPQLAHDTQGAVFTVQHGSRNSVWVNTLFDLPAGRMQYVSFIPDVLVTTVDVKLTPIGESHTSVEVTYVRTALQPSANDDVRALGSSDHDSGPQWQEAIETHLGLNRK